MGKKTQFILAIDSSFFGVTEGFGTRGISLPNADHLLNDDKTGGHLVLRQRERLEHMEQYRQVLPYVVLYRTLENGERQYFAYRRTEKVGESRLAGNVSIGYGGHIDAVDTCWNDDDSINLRETMVSAVNRELEEEAILVSEDDENLRTRMMVSDIIVAGVILDKDDCKKNEVVPVGNVHAGYVIFQEVYPGTVVMTKEDELANMEPMTAKELLASGLPLESWTKTIAERESTFLDWERNIYKQEFGVVSVDANNVI